MGKSVEYHEVEVIWRTKWKKGGWQIRDIVKVSSSKKLKRRIKRDTKSSPASHHRFTCLIKLVIFGLLLLSS